MFKKIVLVSFLAISGANAGMFDSITSAATTATGGGTQEVSVNALDATIKNYVIAKTLLQKSSDTLAKALLSKEEAAKFESALKAAKTISDPQEKEAAINKVQSDKETAISAALESQETKDKFAKANQKTTNLLLNGGFNFMLSGLKYKDTLSSAKSMMASLSANPMAATKYSSQLGQLKDMVVTLPDNIITIANIGDKLYGLASANGIKFVAPTDSKQAPKESGK